jgi:hypothetical protein
MDELTITNYIKDRVGARLTFWLMPEDDEVYCEIKQLDDRTSSGAGPTAVAALKAAIKANPNED